MSEKPWERAAREKAEAELKPWERTAQEKADKETELKPWELAAQEKAEAEAAAEEAKAPRKQGIVDSIMAGGQALLSGPTFGFGDEIAAAGRTVIGQATNPFLGIDEDWGKMYDREVTRGREAEDIARENTPVAMLTAEIGSSMLPALKIAGAVGNMATRGGNMAAQSGLAAGEMAVREVGGGEGGLGERVEGINWGTVGLGGILGAGAGGLMRGQRSIDELAAAKDARRTADGTITNTGFEAESNAAASTRHIRDDLYTNVREEVGEQEARTLVSVDHDANVAKQALHSEDRLSHEALDSLSKAFDADPAAAKLVADAGAVVDGQTLSGAARLQMLDGAQARLAKTNPEAAEAFGRMRTEMEMMQEELRKVFPGAKFEDGYFPISFRKDNHPKIQIGRKKGRDTSVSTMARDTGIVSEKQAAEILNNPVHTFLNTWEDTVDALAMARRFGVTSDVKNVKSIGSYSTAVIDAVEKQFVEKLGKEGAARLANNLRLFAVDGKKGMSPLFQLLRTASSAALLGTPENALLQAGDLGAAAYNNNFMTAVKALPKALRSVIMTNGDNVVVDGYEGTLRAADLGITRQHFAEMFNNNAEGGFARTIDALSDRVMKFSGVKGANRLGQETNMNAAVNRMKGMSKDELASSSYAEGLTEEGVAKLHTALQGDNLRDPAITEAVFYNLGRIQPLSRTAVPAKYLEMNNGRLLYSMKMYMTKMASRMNEDVFKPLREGEKLGAHTKEGQALIRKAILNSGRYSGFLLSLNALVDPGRKELFRGKENDRTFGEEFKRQGLSFATGGLVDTARIEREGIAKGMVPPAVMAGLSPVEFAIRRLISDDDFSAEELEDMARYTPGLRQILWTDEAVNRDN